MSQIEAGRYKATVLAATVSESSNKTPGVFIDFQIDEGGTIRGNLWLSDKAYGRSLETLRKVFGFNNDFPTIQGQLEGKSCSIVIEMEPDQKDPDKQWPRVKWINPVDAGPKPVAPADSSLLARLTRRAAQTPWPADCVPPNPKPAPAPRSAPAPTRAPAAPINDEDVPF